MKWQILIIMMALLVNICAFGNQEELEDLGPVYSDTTVYAPRVATDTSDPDEFPHKWLLESSDGLDVDGNPAEYIPTAQPSRNYTDDLCYKKTKELLESAYSSPRLQKWEGGTYFKNAEEYFAAAREATGDPEAVMLPCRQEHRAAKSIKIIIDQAGRSNDDLPRNVHGFPDLEKAKVTYGPDNRPRQQKLILEVEFEDPKTGEALPKVTHEIPLSAGEPLKNNYRPTSVGRPLIDDEIDQAFKYTGLNQKLARQEAKAAGRPLNNEDIQNRIVTHTDIDVPENQAWLADRFPLKSEAFSPAAYRRRYPDEKKRDAAVARDFNHSALAKHLRSNIHFRRSHQVTFAELEKHIADLEKAKRDDKYLKDLRVSQRFSDYWNDYRTWTPSHGEKAMKITERILSGQSYCNGESNQRYIAPLTYAMHFYKGLFIHARSHASGYPQSHGCPGIDVEHARQIYCLMRQKSKFNGEENWERATVEVWKDASYVNVPKKKPSF